MVSSRRDLLKYLSLAGAAPAVSLAQAPAKGPFTLPPLPYAFDALEPHIDARTMEIHHDRHHAAYVNNLNAAVAGHPDWASKSITQLMAQWQSAPEAVRTAIRNNGGGHINHSFFWNVMKKNGGGKPSGELAAAIDKKFGGFDALKDQFNKSAMGVFGSGWAWLIKDGGGALSIGNTPNQDNPWMHGGTPVIGIDVWEHAYYLKHQNKRADYVAAWWNTVNWDFASEQFLKKA
ncbi:MAG: superoxide dismutase [Bryobacterales bacterium]|nr:superoxide dismutase [Bryobacterales bacterium]